MAAVKNIICLYGGSLYFSDHSIHYKKKHLLKLRIDKSLTVCLRESNTSEYSDFKSGWLAFVFLSDYHEMDQLPDICMFPSNLDLFVQITNSQSRRGMASVCLSSDSRGWLWWLERQPG